MFLNEIKFHNPEFLIHTFLCDNDNNFSYYKTVDEFNRDIYNLKQVIESTKFKQRLINKIYESLIIMKHPLSNKIKNELMK